MEVRGRMQDGPFLRRLGGGDEVTRPGLHLTDEGAVDDKEAAGRSLDSRF